MADRLRATRLKSYGGVALRPGDEFVADSKFGTAIVAAGLATLIESNVEAAPAPSGTDKSRHGKRRYKTRHLTAER